MTPVKRPSNHTAFLTLLGILMTSHLIFLGFNANGKDNGIQAFQRASETYIAILLALMTPLNPAK